MRPIQYLFAATLFLSMGCNQHYYSPNFLHTPQIGKKGDGVVTAAVSGSPVALNGDFHAAYSPVRNGTLMLNFFRNHKSFRENNFLGGTNYLQQSDGFLLEAAAGTYRPFAYGTIAVYAGWGRGKVHNDYGIGRIAALGLERFFLQPCYTFKNKWLRLGMGVRLVRLSYPFGHIDYRIEPGDIQIIQGLENDSPFWFTELGGNLGIHFKPFTISANMVLVPSRKVSVYGFDSSNAGIGVSIELQELFQKKRTPKTELKPN